MTQLDLPNISFTHYLDLLKRRTWHVLIVSVLGLVIGGIVAMLVPRYYVAMTTVELSKPILDPKRGTPEDPMSQLINAAMVTVPTGVQKAVRDLGWTEGLSGDEESRIAFMNSVKKRIVVQDIGPGNRGRQIAHLLISYRDTDGERAASMTNELRRQWLTEFVDGLKQRAEQEIQAVIVAKNSKRVEKLRAAKLVQVFEEENEINPEDWIDQRTNGMTSVFSAEIRDLQRRVDDINAEINGLNSKLSFRKADLDALSPTLRANVQDLLSDPMLRKEYTEVTIKILRVRKMLDGIKPAHQDYEAAKNTLAHLTARITELEKIAGGEAPEQPNPEYLAVEKEIRELKVDLSVKKTSRVELEARLKSMKERRSRLPSIYLEYENLRERLKLLTDQETSLNEEFEDKSRIRNRISTDRPYRVLEHARIPPRPTEPNPVMLALIGCIVGLGLAIALVLLIDFLQMSFKSVVDVESGLGLPVLGTMSYLETDREVTSARGRRALVTGFAVMFLVLLLTIVTIYYILPSSLPIVVTDILDQILGEPKPR